MSKKMKAKTIGLGRLIRLAVCGSKKLPQLINDGGVRKRWVGIGWIDEGAARGTETKVRRINVKP